MGDPKKSRKTYKTPRHPWQKARIDSEKEVRKQYGTVTKKEIWKMDSLLKSFQDRIKKAATGTSEQEKTEEEALLKKVRSYKLISENENADKILSLGLEDIMARRLQTIVFTKQLARSVKQARQFITHGHITINDQIITSPSYLVTEDEEAHVKFKPSSSLDDIEHPERTIKEKVEVEKLKEEMEKMAAEAPEKAEAKE